MAIEARDDQRGKLAPFPHQHHDIAGPRIACLPLGERIALVHPAPHLPGDIVGHQPVVPRQPASLLLALFVLRPGRDGVPQDHLPRPVAADMLSVGTLESEPGMPDLSQRVVHE